MEEGLTGAYYQWFSDNKMKGDVIEWEVGPIPPAKFEHLGFTLLGLDKDDYDEVELFYSNLHGEVIGADPI